MDREVIVFLERHKAASTHRSFAHFANDCSRVFFLDLFVFLIVIFVEYKIVVVAYSRWHEVELVRSLENMAALTILLRWAER